MKKKPGQMNRTHQKEDRKNSLSGHNIGSDSGKEDRKKEDRKNMNEGMTGEDRKNSLSGHNIGSDSGKEDRKEDDRKNPLSGHPLSGPNSASTADYRYIKEDRKVSISKERIKSRRSYGFYSLLAIIERQGNLK